MTMHQRQRQREAQRARTALNTVHLTVTSASPPYCQVLGYHVFDVTGPGGHCRYCGATFEEEQRRIQELKDSAFNRYIKRL